MPKENILIIAVKKPEQHEDRFHSSLDELVSLSTTAGGTVQKVITQNRNRIHPAYYIGEGKMNEIKQELTDLEIDLVISNDELSAGQLRNLSSRFNVRVIDRSQLILDIFAGRAKTKEGKLQVELAQLEYMLPRLHGQGTELSRLGGGIGTRGPGETKLESDQRHIRRRIDEIKRRLKLVVQQREQYRKRRKARDVFQIAIVGYTNAGKSTLFNRLTKGETMVEDQLFATLDPLTRQIRLPSGFQTLITDTVGFIQDLPTALVAAFRSTLEEVSGADFILHVVDSSNEDFIQHQETVLNLLKELHADTISTLTVYNKQDLSADFIPVNYPYISISALANDATFKVTNKIEAILKEDWERYRVQLPPDAGKLLHRIEQETIIEKKYYDETVNNYIINGFIRPKSPLQSVIKEYS